MVDDEVQAVAKLQHLSVLNIACIAAAIVVIDGPLLQRASSVTRATQTTNVTLDLQLLPEIPANVREAMVRSLAAHDVARCVLRSDNLYVPLILWKRQLTVPTIAFSSLEIRPIGSLPHYPMSSRFSPSILPINRCA